MIVVFPDHAHLLRMLNVKKKTAVFAYKYSKCLDVCASANSHPKFLGAQWLSGRVHVLRLKGCGLEPHWRCVFEHVTFNLD